MALLLCFFVFAANMSAQEANDSLALINDSLAIKDAEADSLRQVEKEAEYEIGGKIKPSKYIPTEEDMKQTFFQGFTVSTDLLNMGLYFFSSYGNIDASLRLNLLNTYFPVVELGVGKCDKTDFNTKIRFKTDAPFLKLGAPYLKVGVDYNLLKNKWQTNKLLIGLRYGITNYKCSIEGPDQTDPIWKTTGPLEVNSVSATSHYAEVVFGCQVKIWSFIHMGWTARYKMEIHTTKNLYSHPYYIPGYGTTVNGSYWGATYNICFDLNWGKKKPSVKQVVENAIEDIKQNPNEKK